MESRNPSTHAECSLLTVRRMHWHEYSTAPHGDVETRRFRITHPYNPLFQQEFELVCYRQDWGEDRVWFQDKFGRLHSLPTSCFFQAEDGIRDIGRCFLAGQLVHAEAICALAAPT